MNKFVLTLVVAVAIIILGVLLIRRRGGANALLCAKCGADLESSGRCVECGWVVVKPIGEVGRVTVTIRTNETGEVKVHGRRWKAQQASPMTPLNAGTSIRVVASRGMMLVVGPIGTGPRGRARFG